jgi:hypothetical protein
LRNTANKRPSTSIENVVAVELHGYARQRSN